MSFELIRLVASFYFMLRYLKPLLTKRKGRDNGRILEYRKPKVKIDTNEFIDRSDQVLCILL